MPNNLQGEVFWNPTSHGWEGERRHLILERRSAQLAAIGEAALENPLIVSNGPADPVMDRWVQRQIAQKGDRNKKLLERLWLGVKWQRHDRVLVLAGGTIFWALKPLQSVPEGGVTLAIDTKENKKRVVSEFEIFDSMISLLRRYRILSIVILSFQYSQALFKVPLIIANYNSNFC